MIAAQAWREQGLGKVDPNGWLDLTKGDLVQREADAAQRMNERVHAAR